MSTADDAWRAWSWLNEVPVVSKAERTAFMAAYRRALEDAADAVRDVRENGLPVQAVSHPTHEYIERWLRDRAAGVGTKDGADDE